MIYRLLLLVVAFFLLSISTQRDGFAQAKFWQQTNGPYGDRISSFSVARNGTLFAVKERGSKIFRSADDGISWIAIKGPGDIVLISATSNGKLLITLYTSFGYGDLRLSMDSGRTWSLSMNGIPPNSYVRTLWADNNNVFFIFVPSHGVLKSTTGDQWVLSSSGLPNGIEVFCFAQDSVGRILAGTGNGVFMSEDSGTSWSPLNSGIESERITALTSDENGGVYAGTQRGVYVSTNAGSTWDQSNNGLAADTVVTSIASSPSGNVFLSAHSRWSDPPTARDPAIFRSTDSGSNWVRLNREIESENQLVSTQSGSLIMTHSRGIIRSIDEGLTWENSVNGIPADAINAIFGSSTGRVLAGTTAGISLSSDNGLNWNNVDSIEANDFTSFCENSFGHLFASSFGGKVFRSTDQGEHWTGFPFFGAISFVNGLAANSLNEIFAATTAPNGGYGGINCSTDNGENWEFRNNGLPSNPYRNIRAIMIDSLGILYASSTTGGVYVSTNNGNYWVQATNGLPNNSNVISFACKTNGVVFAGLFYGDGVYRSTDRGTTWTSINNGLPRIDAWALAVNSHGHLFCAGYDEGVFSSTDDGNTWNPVNSGLSDSYVRSLAVSRDGFLFAGSVDEAIFRSINPTTSVSGRADPLPMIFDLSQNYPNPFNPSTTIKFQIPHSSFVSLKIINLLGQEVATLMSDEQPAGSYTVAWNAEGFASGVYFYRLTTNDVVLTKKMLLIQ